MVLFRTVIRSSLLSFEHGLLRKPVTAFRARVRRGRSRKGGSHVRSRMRGNGAPGADPAWILPADQRAGRRICRRIGGGRPVRRGPAAAPVEAQAQRSFTGVVDLTHPMSADFPTFFGVPGIEMQKQFDIGKDGFNLYWWRIIEHAGTHLDAPIHFSADGATADKLDAATLVVPLAVVDVAAKAARDPDYLVSRQDLVDWEGKNGRLPDGCCVAMHSGWAQHVTDAPRYTGRDSAGVFHFPGFAADAADWLIKERRVQ